MKIRPLRCTRGYGIRGQIINVPVDVNTMTQCLPRSLDNDYVFNVHLRRNIIHKSTYLAGFIHSFKKRVLKMETRKVKMRGWSL